MTQYNHPDILTWHENWFAALAAEFDHEPEVTCITTSELAYGTLAIPFSSIYNPANLNPESLTSYRAGRFHMLKRMKHHFKQTAVSQDANVPKVSVHEWFGATGDPLINHPIVDRVWPTVSNTNWGATTNASPGSSGGQGALWYWQALTGIVPKVAQWQDDMNSIDPATGLLHTMESFLERMSDPFMGNSYVIIQRKRNVINGHGFEEYDNFIKTFPSPTHGLVTARPSILV